jgi:hypothetical protein
LTFVRTPELTPPTVQIDSAVVTKATKEYEIIRVNTDEEDF